jgi:hypothetical protein
MAAPHINPGFAHRWLRRLLPASVTILIVASLGAVLVDAVAKARKAAYAADTL